MEPLQIGIASLVLVAALILIRVPLFIAIGSTGFAGITILIGLNQSTTQLYQVAASTLTEFVMLSIPLFIFMGYLVAEGGLARDLFECAHRWFGKVPGGLAISSVAACTAFGAVTGVSGAAVATMGTVVIPEMQRHRYELSFGAASIASASTIAILIPPSLPLIVYGIWTNTSISKLFLAGIVPGLLVATTYALLIGYSATRHPSLAPRSEGYSFRSRVESLAPIWPVMFIFAFIIYGLYGGLFTPSEAGGCGVGSLLVILLLRGRLSWTGYVRACRGTATLSLMIFAVLIAVSVFSRFLVLTDVIEGLITWVASLALHRFVLITIVITVYLILGMFLDGLSMMLLTLPFTFPLVTQAGFDPIWFGVILTIMIEIGLLTPPVGLNCYILRKACPAVDLSALFWAVTPFVLVTLFCVALFTALPRIVLYLPTRF